MSINICSQNQFVKDIFRFIMSYRFQIQCLILCTVPFSKTVFLLIIFGNRKRWNRGVVNGMQH